MAIELNIVENNPVSLSLDSASDVELSAEEAVVISVKDYEALDNKPSIGGVELVGNKSLNDLGGYTQSQIADLLSDKADKSDIPTKTSDLTNDSGYITLADLPIYNGGVS